MSTCGEVGGQAKLLIGSLHKASEAALADAQRLQVLQSFRGFQLLELSFHLQSTSCLNEPRCQ